MLSGSSAGLARTSDNKIQSVAAAEAYWTPERMANAIPAQGIGTMLNESQTVGKVFFTNPANGLNYVCSGATVKSLYDFAESLSP